MLSGVARTMSWPLAVSLADGVTELVAVTSKSYVASSMPAQSQGTAIVNVEVVVPQAGADGPVGLNDTHEAWMAVGSARYAVPKSMAVKARENVSRTLPSLTTPTVYVAELPGSTSPSMAATLAWGSPNERTFNVADVAAAHPHATLQETDDEFFNKHRNQINYQKYENYRTIII